MRWEDERYIKLYTRDTTDWLCLSWRAQGLFCLILRKADRAGILELGKRGKQGLSAHIGGPAAWPEMESALEELISDGCVEVQGDRLIIPNYVNAQEARATAAARKREERETARDLARANPSGSVTRGHAVSHDVTRSHEPEEPIPAQLSPAHPRREENSSEELCSPTVKTEIRAPERAGPRNVAVAVGDERLGTVVSEFKAVWLEHNRFPYMPLGLDTEELKDFVRRIGDTPLPADEIRRRLEHAWQDEFFRDKQPTLRFFLRQWNRFGSAPKATDPPEKTWKAIAPMSKPEEFNEEPPF